MPISVRHLYLHLPFCPSICPYCSFHVERVDRAKMEGFAARLESELREADFSGEVETVYLGGGTPTAFSTTQLAEILGIVERWVRRDSACETTLEANPSTLAPEKCRLLRQWGVNRVSLGAQSFDDGVLRTLGRKHSSRAVRAAWDNLRSAGFKNLNIDLMFGVPGQSQASWQSSLRTALDLGPEHLSCYNLTYEQDTPFMERFQRGDYRENNDLNQTMFEMAEEQLGVAGYHHYEISNYARPGFECRHNLAYWTGRDYLGLGPSAVSTVGGRRWKSENGTRVMLESLTPGQRAREQALLELRTSRGARAGEFTSEQMTPLLEDGLASLQDGRLILTRAGRLRADEIAVHLL